MLTNSNMGGGSLQLNCLKKKGFTLIELLAVIVILAIIAVIATPIITGIIEDSKKASFERSVEGIVDATRFDITNRLTEEGYTYQFENGNIDLGANVKVSNAKNLSGTIKYNSEGEVSYAIHNNKWCVIKDGESASTTDYVEGKCKLKEPTIAEAFTYEANIESFEIGDNCVSYFQNEMSLFEEDATSFCSGGTYGDATLKERIERHNWGYDIETLKTNNVIKNVVLSSTEVAITGYDINKGGVDVVIPSKIDGKTVIVIGEGTFANNFLTSITIPNGVKIIGDGAFVDNQLTSVTIPGSVKFIGDMAFKSNQLKNVIIQDGVEVIKGAAFAGNQLTDVTIPGSVTTINGGLFENNEQPLNVTLLEGVTSIEMWAFRNIQLTSITIPNTVTVIEQMAFSNNQLTDVTIPGSVTHMGERLFFQNEKPLNLVLSEGITEIYNYVFENSHLVSVEIPNSVKHIGQAAFRDNQLTSVVLPNSEIIIEDFAFSNNQLTDVTIPSKLGSSLGFGIFSDNQLTSVTIQEGVEYIHPGMFANNQLTSVVIPNSVIDIGGYAFANNKLTSLPLLDNIHISGGAFNGNQLPEEQAFIYSEYRDGGHSDELVSYGGAKRENVVIPNSVATISWYVFTNQEYGFPSPGVTSITIPESVECISSRAFYKYSDDWYSSNPNLTKIINKTGKSFDWGSIINDSSGYEFITGTVESEYGNVEITSE